MCKVNYNEISKVYDSVRDGDQKTIDRIIEEGEITISSSVLEIGCGTGNYTDIMQRESGCSVYGFDQSEGMLEKAKQKNSNIQFYLGDAVKLDCFSDSMFDVIYMVDVIHHIRDIDIMFKNIYRILKPNGKVFVFTDSYDHIRNRLTTKYFPETLEVELNRYQSTEELFSSLKDNQFKNIKSDTIFLSTKEHFGQKLIAVAEVRGYSMFNLISDEAIDRGINRIKDDMKTINICYDEKAPYILGYK